MTKLYPTLAKACFAGWFLVSASACGTGDVQSVIETVIAQTEQSSSLETAATQAEGGLLAPSETPLPPTAAATLAAFDPNPFPADFGTLVEQNGRWFFNDAEVVFTQHSEADGTTSTWLSLAGETDWPLFIQPSAGVWRPGFEEWSGAIEIINTTELTVDLSLAGGEAFTGSSEPQEQQITPYEIFIFSSFPPGDYAFTFAYGTAQYACILHFEQNSKYHVIIVPEGIAVLEEHITPQSGAEFNILNSPLCIH